jgi:hypothetical protein
VTVSANGTSVVARVAIRERQQPGAAFLIEGTLENNANVLVNGVARAITVEPLPTPESQPAEPEEQEQAEAVE